MRASASTGSWNAVLGLCLLLALAASISTVTAQDPAPAAAAPAGEPVTGDEPPPQRSNFLAYCWEASPTFFIGMLLLSVVMVYFAINNFIKLQLEKFIPPAFVASIEGLLTEKKFKEAYERAKTEPSPIGKSLTAGIERLSQGYDKGMEAMLGQADDTRMEYEHSIAPVNVIAAIAPMLGLLGTVLGMILAFQKLGLGTQIQPAELAKDIGLALVSTLEGLIVAIPAIPMFAFLRNRLARMMYEVEKTGETYLVKFASAMKKSS